MRQRAIDLLYAMCDQSNAVDIVGELMQYLEKADYSIRETLVSGRTHTHTHYTFEGCFSKFVYA